MLRLRVFFPILYVLVVKFIFVVVQIPDWHGGQCQSGSWKSIGSAAPWTSVTSFTLYPTTTKALGKFKLCVNTYRIDGKETAMTRVWPTDNPDVNGEMNW